jgi:hypothetical protein
MTGIKYIFVLRNTNMAAMRTFKGIFQVKKFYPFGLGSFRVFPTLNDQNPCKALLFNRQTERFLRRLQWECP